MRAIIVRSLIDFSIIVLWSAAFAVMQRFILAELVKEAIGDPSGVLL